LKENLFTDTGRTTPIKLAKEAGQNGMTMATPLVDALIAEVRAREIDLLLIDPFVASHSISENDNVKIDRVMKEGWNIITERGDCGVGITPASPDPAATMSMARRMPVAHRPLLTPHATCVCSM
jgi:hypothetical protein